LTFAPPSQWAVGGIAAALAAIVLCAAGRLGA
jgi:hypothetical protein